MGINIYGVHLMDSNYESILSCEINQISDTKVGINQLHILICV